MPNPQSPNNSELENNIGITFKNAELLQEALTHRSYINEHGDFKAHNERLEFLGDAVLELIITETIFAQFPDLPEGEMTAIRAAIVRRETLAQVAQDLTLDHYIKMSKGESNNKGKAREAILANAFEALTGAIYLDQGYETVSKFLLSHLKDRIGQVFSDKAYIDAKSRVQEILQAKRSITPNYKVLEETGPDHDKHFTIGIYAGEDLLATGTGQNKQQAETSAAREALTKLE